jgi:hypothetical protein
MLVALQLIVKLLLRLAANAKPFLQLMAIA